MHFDFNPHEARSSWRSAVFRYLASDAILIHTKREARGTGIPTASPANMNFNPHEARSSWLGVNDVAAAVVEILIHTKREARGGL